MRENLVDTILELSGDELQYEDLVVIAKESDEQLVERLIHISNYYKVQANQ